MTPKELIHICMKDFDKAKNLGMPDKSWIPFKQAWFKAYQLGEDNEVTDNEKGQYVIVDLRNMDFMKNKEGKINYYNTMDEACSICGMYEFENAWVVQLMYNHIEDEM